MRFHSKGRLLVGLSALAVGLMGCADSSSSTSVASSNENEVDKVASELGEPVTGCSVGVVAQYVNTLPAAINTLTIANFTGTVVISAPGGILKMNGQTCVAADGKALTVTGAGIYAVKKIVMNDSDVGGVTKSVMLDMFSGPFTSVFAGGLGNGLEVNFQAAAVGSFLIRGGNGIDKVNMASSTATPGLYFDIGVATDGKADVKVLNTTAVVPVKVSLAGGADVFAPITTGMTSGISGALVTPVFTTFTNPLTIYGGDGDDILTDGPGVDTVFGGLGSDTIKASNVGNDTFFGGGGTDIIDYGARTAGVAVTANLLISTTGILSGDPAIGDTVTIGAKTYKFVLAINAGTPTVNEVLWGADADAARANLVLAIGKGLTEGTNYKCPTACAVDPSVTAVVATTTVVVTPVDSYSSAILLSEAGAATSWDATSLYQTATATGGETDKLYEFENVTGGLGNDTLTGSEGPNLIYGGLGNDSINGGAGADTLYGGDGNDAIYGGAGLGIDNLYGDAGDDAFWADPAADGVDIINGGAGTGDTVNYSLRAVLVSPIVTVSVTVGTAGAEENIKSDVETLIGSDGDDVLAFLNTMPGALAINGRDGSINSLTGSPLATNTLTGGTGVDTITGGNLADAIYGGGGNDVISAGTGNDYIEGGGGDDDITCGTGDDVVYGELGNDTINGGDGNDTISGFDGNDILNGDNGDDVISGGIGNDTMTGGTGVDNINGGPGLNSFNGGGQTGDVCITLEATSPAAEVFPVANSCEVF